MKRARWWLVASVGWALVTVLRAADPEEGVLLRERLPGEGEVIRTTLTAVQEGKLVLPGEGSKDQKLRLRAEARLVFEDAAPQGTKMRVRYLEDAAVGVLVQGRKVVRSMREAVRLVAVHLRDGSLLFYSPLGPLTYEELQMLQYPFDPFVFDWFLPEGGRVRAMQRWKLGDEAVRLMLRFEELQQHDLQAVCEQITAEKVTIRIAGTAVGTFAVAPARITVNAVLEYDRAQRLIRQVRAELEESKSPGPVEPGMEGTVRVTLERSLVQARHLTPQRLALVPAEPPRTADYLVFEHEGGLFRLYYPRRWRVHFADKSSLVLKWVDREGLVAQCNVVLGHKGSPGTHLEPAKIREQVLKAVGKHRREVLEERTLPSEGGLWVYRMAIAGVVGKEPVVWHYYTVADRDGQHLYVVFSVPASKASIFGAADLEIVQSLQMPAPRAAERISRGSERAKR